MSPFAIRIASPDLLFSVGHFITFADGQVEALHGHDYRATAEIRGRLGASGYLVDFTEVHGLFKALLAELDHRVLLPEKHPAMRIEQSGEEFVVTYARKRWVFPRTDCRLLPLVNTTAEALAEHLAQQLFHDLTAEKGDRSNLPERPKGCFAQIGPVPFFGIDSVQVEVREGAGFSGICTLPGK